MSNIIGSANYKPEKADIERTFHQAVMESYKKIQEGPEQDKEAREAALCMESDIRSFLYNHLDIPKAGDMNAPFEEVLLQLNLAGYQLANTQVGNKPELSGMWLLKAIGPTTWKEVLIFCNPKRVSGGGWKIKRIQINK
jgi:hypothetical protein